MRRRRHLRLVNLSAASVLRQTQSRRLRTSTRRGCSSCKRGLFSECKLSADYTNFCRLISGTSNHSEEICVTNDQLLAFLTRIRSSELERRAKRPIEIGRASCRERV